MFPHITHRFRLNVSFCFISVLSLMLMFLVPTRPARADGPAYLVKDIQTTSTRNDSSFAQGLYAIGNTTYFFAVDPDHGVELWKSDGTDSGTMLVKDINPGRGLALHDTSSTGFESPQFTSIGNTLFFVVDDGIFGQEVWRSDGTEQGTNIVKDIYPGATGSNPTELTSVGETLFFVADDGEHGTELWRSDGTEQGTTIEDMSPGKTDSDVFDLTAVGNELFFAALVQDSESSYSFAIWKSDGTAAEIVKVHTLSYPCYSEYQYQTLTNALTNVQGTLFFIDCNDFVGADLWRSDGTEEGTFKLASKVINNYDVSALTAVGNTLFFRANDKLWKSDGTVAGTVLVKAVKPSNLTSVHNTLFFAGDDGINGNELWRSDGSDAGTVIVKDVNPGVPGSNPINITPFHEGIVFAADDGTHGYELWRSDGTENGTALVQDIYAGSTGAFYSGSVRYPWAVTANGTLFFPPNDDSVGYELWRSDGTAEGTRLVKDIAKNYTYYDVNNSLEMNGLLFFTAIGDGTGQELWRSDGTEAGTFPVKDIRPGTQGSYPHNLTNANGTLFFIADDGVHGNELWRSDGTEAGTVMVVDLAPGADYFSILSLVSMNGAAFFTAYISGQGYSLWRSDGTAAGTFKLKDTGFVYLTAINDKLVFITSDTDGWRLWKSDGTSDGTVVVKSIDKHIHFNYSPQFALVNKIMYFIVYNDLSRDGYSNVSSTYELWRSDGTDSGTIPFKSFDASPADYGVLGYIQAMGNKVYFVGSDADHGSELWSSDGTQEGTQLVADIYPGLANATPQDLTSINNTLFFSAVTRDAGRELWRSDGTATGTSLVKDIAPGTSGSTFDHFTQANGELFFAANDGVSGTELWRSDGNSTGTTLVQDIAPGGASSAPSNLTVSNGRLFFSADDQVHGYELWALRLADLPPPPPTATATSIPSPTATSTVTPTPTDEATATSTATATTVATATPNSTPEAPIASLRNHMYMPNVVH